MAFAMSDGAFRVCSSCRKPIGFGEGYYVCSVSTCNRKKIGLFFCSVPCWDAHLPSANHREAWAVEETAPSRAEWLAEQQTDEQDHRERTSEPRSAQPPIRRVVATGAAPHAQEQVPQSGEVLVVMSKLKAFIREHAEMNTSDRVAGVISDHLRELCVRAVRAAGEDERKTVLDRDFVKALERWRQH
jgi:histone H3/H4